MTDIFEAIQKTAIRIKDAIDVKDFGYQSGYYKDNYLPKGKI